MSRSALEKQHARRVAQGAPVNASGVAHVAAYDAAELLSETREAKPFELPVHGNTRTYNLNNLLAQNIMASEYFISTCRLTTFEEIVDEIYERCEHCAPWATGTSRIPSSAFCLLMRLFVMRVTTRQMQTLLDHPDSPYIRAIGMLYLRYTCPPTELWKWMELYLDDEEQFTPSPDASAMSFGEFTIKLIKEMPYFGTQLPRIPVLIERKMKVQLLLHGEKKKRAVANLMIKGRLRKGVKVRAIYADEENDPAWYEATIDSVVSDDQGGGYWVTFPEYGNSALVGLGEIQLPESLDQSRSRSRDPHRERSEQRREAKHRDDGRRDRGRSHRDDRGDRGRRRESRSRSGGRRRKHDSRSRSRDRVDRRLDEGYGASSLLDLNPSQLYEQVVENDRKNSTAIGRDYASRPTSYKGSLSLKPDRYTARRKSSSRSPERIAIAATGGSSRRRSPSPRARPMPTAGPKITAESLRKAEEMKRRYGDASAKAR